MAKVCAIPSKIGLSFQKYSLKVSGVSSATSTITAHVSKRGWHHVGLHDHHLHHRMAGYMRLTSCVSIYWFDPDYCLCVWFRNTNLKKKQIDMNLGDSKHPSTSWKEKTSHPSPTSSIPDHQRRACTWGTLATYVGQPLVTWSKLSGDGVWLKSY